MALTTIELVATKAEAKARERKALGRYSMAIRYGDDPTADRQLYAEFKAERELREAAARLVAARVAQGHSERITDAATLARIATLIAEPLL